MNKNVQRLSDDVLDAVNGGTDISVYREADFSKAGLHSLPNGNYAMHFEGDSSVEISPRLATSVIQSTNVSGRRLTKNEFRDLQAQC